MLKVWNKSPSGAAILFWERLNRVLVGSDKLELDFVLVLPTEKTSELLSVIALIH